MANEGVVVPFILEDGIGTCIPLNPLLKLVSVMYDSDASEDTVDRGVVARVQEAHCKQSLAE